MERKIMKFEVLKDLGKNWFSKLRYQDNTVWMVRNIWNDFGYKTMYHMAICISNKIIPLGDTCIMRRGQETEFTFEVGQLPLPLSDDYISLGHQKYYEALMGLSETARNEILSTLKDTVFENREQGFIDDNVFNTSLLRGNSISKISFYKTILEDKLEQTPFELTMFLKAQGSEDLVEFSFSTTPNQMPPSNIHALIGRNASGKTQFLNALSVFTNKLDSQRTDSSSNEVTLNDSLYQSINVEPLPFPLSKNIHILISQKGRSGEKSSEKDPFERNLRHIEINFNVEQMGSDLKMYLEFCLKSLIVKSRWIKLFSEINSDPLFKELELIPSNDPLNPNIDDILNKYKISSAGHKYIIFILTALVYYVDDRSLVTIDEPENHLHPPLLSSFIRALSQLLMLRNGIAILATHSPVVLQEIPSSCVSIINRSGQSIKVTRPTIETFAENIGTLTQEVFKLEVRRSGFYKLLQQEVENQLSYEEILEKFDRKIGLEGKVQLSALINGREAEGGRNDFN